LGSSSLTIKDGGERRIHTSSDGEQRRPWMFIEMRFLSEKLGKWKQESGAVVGVWVWVFFIGPEQRRNVEVRRWFDGWQRWTLQCISYGSGGELRGRKTEGRALARRGRGGGDLDSTVMWHDAVARGQISGADG
jgi:hypothetical protein